MDPIRILPGEQFSNLNLITIAKLISALVILVMIIASISFVITLLTGGIKWILSAGKKEKVNEAKNQIINALVGLLVVFSAWAIMNFISVFFGVDLLSFEIPTINP